ncbi:MAG: hypothetical protein HY574_00335 [candidate division NC10 bacterium]|nr:hypothetical protein [candidate division NC10 bacterium]
MMRIGFWESICALVIVVGLAGCVTTGSIGGRLSVPGEPVAGVTFSFQSERFGEGGRLFVILPSGEYFSGRYLQITSTSTADVVQPISMFWGPRWHPWGPFDPPWIEEGDHTTFVRNYSGKVVATLFGDKDNTMRCRFQLTNPEAGLSSGGVGECQVSNGGTIEVEF